MCGIAGVLVPDGEVGAAHAGVVARLNDAQARRGPDGSGLWTSDCAHAIFGHRRLAIIDLEEAASQPMTDSSGRWTISFNGEIYNYRALRAELERLGHAFRTQSDTEVLIAVFAQWGAAGLRRLRGMFAFALWDGARKELWLARDPHGIKPLYVSRQKGATWFASQARALARHAPGAHDRDAAALTGFYLWGHVPEPFSWWRDIEMFPAGHVQCLPAMGPARAPECFHSIVMDYAAEPCPLAPGELKDLLLDSVRHHLVADTKVGIFLSAGVDSSVIAALAAECGAPLTTITLAFDEYAGTGVDEAPLAEATARKLASQHATIRIGREEFENLADEFLAAMDQPSIDGLNSFLISRAAASQGLKVALSGLGGDELFGGYPAFHRAPKLAAWGRRIPARTALDRIATAIRRAMPQGIFSPKASGVFRYSASLGEAYFLVRALNLESDLEQLLDQSWTREGLERLDRRGAIARLLAPLAGVAPHAQISALESTLYMRNQLLRDTDWASMAHGLEVRVPLVDAALIGRLAPAIASPSPPGKRDLAGAAPGLAEEILERPKTGFTTPVRQWMAQSAGSRTAGLRPWASLVHAAFRAAP